MRNPTEAGRRQSLLKTYRCCRRPAAVNTKKAVQCSKNLRKPLEIKDRALNTVYQVSISAG